MSTRPAASPGPRASARVPAVPRRTAVRLAVVAFLAAAALAAPSGVAASGATISGVVSPVAGGADGDPPAIDVDGITIQLLTPTGEPVTDPSGAPVTATTTAGGSYTFPDVPRGQFEVAVEPRPGMDSSPASIPVDTTSGLVAGVDFDVAMVTRAGAAVGGPRARRTVARRRHRRAGTGRARPRRPVRSSTFPPRGLTIRPIHSGQTCSGRSGNDYEYGTGSRPGAPAIDR